MPTGYTSILDDSTMPTKQWVMEVLARAFGVCVALREESLSLTEEQIREKIASYGASDMKYHSRELEKAKRWSKKVARWTDEDWTRAYERSQRRIARSNKRSIAEAKRLKVRHDGVKADLEKVFASDVDEFTKDVVKYGLEQLKITERETEPYITEGRTFAEFKEDTIASYKRDISYHTRELGEAQKRAVERVTYYSVLKADLERVLG